MSNVSYDFSERTVIVTGAARGIGLELARGFVAAGADTTLVDADADAVHEAAADLGAHAAIADVTSTADVERVIHEVIERSGRIDILVNNAGLLRDGVVWKLTDDDWHTVLDVHAGGTFRSPAPASRTSAPSSTAG